MVSDDKGTTAPLAGLVDLAFAIVLGLAFLPPTWFTSVILFPKCIPSPASFNGLCSLKISTGCNPFLGSVVYGTLANTCPCLNP